MWTFPKFKRVIHNEATDLQKVKLIKFKMDYHLNT